MPNSQPASENSEINTGTVSCGRKNHFSGVKMEYLDSWSDKFNSLSDNGPFYRRVSAGFVQRFGYDLDIDENPSPLVDISTLAPPAISLDLSLEDQALERLRRYNYQKELRNKLGNWYRYRFNTKKEKGDLIGRVIDALVSSSNVHAPRKRQAVQKYYDLYWEIKIKEQFTELWKGIKTSVHGNDMLWFQNLFVKCCYDDETAEVQRGVEEAVESEHEAAVEKWRKGREISHTAEGYETAWDMAEEVLPGLSNALGDWLGASVIISTVFPENGKVQVKTVQSTVQGSVLSQLLPEYNPDGWKGFCSMLQDYGSNYFSPDDCRFQESAEASPKSCEGDSAGPIASSGEGAGGVAEDETEPELEGSDGDVGAGVIVADGEPGLVAASATPQPPNVIRNPAGKIATDQPGPVSASTTPWQPPRPHTASNLAFPPSNGSETISCTTTASPVPPHASPVEGGDFSPGHNAPLLYQFPVDHAQERSLYSIQTQATPLYNFDTSVLDFGLGPPNHYNAWQSGIWSNHFENDIPPTSSTLAGATGINIYASSIPDSKQITNAAFNSGYPVSFNKTRYDTDGHSQLTNYPTSMAFPPHIQGPLQSCDTLASIDGNSHGYRGSGPPAHQTGPPKPPNGSHHPINPHSHSRPEGSGKSDNPMGPPTTTGCMIDNTIIPPPNNPDLLLQEPPLLVQDPPVYTQSSRAQEDTNDAQNPSMEKENPLSGGANAKAGPAKSHGSQKRKATKSKNSQGGVKRPCPDSSTVTPPPRRTARATVGKKRDARATELEASSKLGGRTKHGFTIVPRGSTPENEWNKSLPC